MFFDFRRGNYIFKHSRTIEQPGNVSGNFGEHFHAHYELLYFIEGEADYKIRHTLYKLEPHSLLVVKPGEVHHILIRSNTAEYERFVVSFDDSDLPAGLRRMIRDLDNVYSIADTPLSEEIFRLDHYYALPDETARYYAMRWQLNIILTCLCTAQDLSRRADSVNEDVQVITDYIDNHLTEIHTLEDIGKGLHISRSNLHKIFSTGFDMPIMRYVRTQKVALAHTLLNDGFPPTEIPVKCGFQNYSSFYRAYRRVYDAPPSGTGRAAS